MPSRMREIVKQYVIHVDGLEYPVHAYIEKYVRDGEEFYDWSISHHYKGKEGAGVYYPSSISDRTIERCETLLKMYVAGFTNIGVKKNKYY